MPDDGRLTQTRIEVVEYLVCSLAEHGEDQVVCSCIRVLGEMTDGEIATVFGCSRQYVQAIAARALYRVKRRAELMPELREAANG